MVSTKLLKIIDGRLVGRQIIRIEEGQSAMLQISSDMKPGIYFLKTGQGLTEKTFKLVVK